MKHNLELQQRAERLIAEAEEQRREAPTRDTKPLPSNVLVPDYGSSGQVMELAMGHLRESVPNGQKLRTELAWAALRLAMVNHEEWLRQKGYAV